MTGTHANPLKKKGRRVIVFRSRLLPYSETFIREQVRTLSRWKGVLVGESLAPNGLSLDGMDVRVLGFRNRVLHKLSMIASSFVNLSPPRVRALKRERADLLHIHFATDAYRFWPVARHLDLPVLITLHGYDITTHRSWWESGKGGGRRMKKFPSGLLHIARDDRVHFIAVSHAIKKSAIDFGIPESKITVGYIGVDTQKFAPGPKPIADRREILYVGRLVEKKGCEYLLRAFADIQKDFPDYGLTIVGGGPLEAQLKAFAEAHNVRATFLGPLSGEQVRERLAEARVFCLPSITAENGDAEGLGIVILEAQASGVPVITSARGGAQEGIVHGKTGFAHGEKDVAAIREGLISLLQDNELATRYGANARRHVVETMDLGRCNLHLEEIYEKHAFGQKVPVETPDLDCPTPHQGQCI